MSAQQPHTSALLLMQDLDQPEAKAAFVWILGHYGESIQARPPAVKQRHVRLPYLLCVQY